MERELGARDSVLRVSGRSAQGDLHDQCGGGFAPRSAEDHQEPGVVSERGDGAEVAVSGAAKHQREVGDGAALERGAEPVRDSVGRSDSSGPERLSESLASTRRKSVGMTAPLAAMTRQPTVMSTT